MRQVVCSLIFVVVSLSGLSQKISIQQQTSIIRMVVDSLLLNENGFNTHGYWIDFSKSHVFQRKAINEFLKQDSNFTEIDSHLLLKNDTTWIQYGYLQKTLIKFSKLKLQRGLLIIEVDKIKATDASIEKRFIIRKENNNYKILSSEITRIS